MTNGSKVLSLREPMPHEARAVRLTERWRVPLDIDVISPAAIAARRVPVV